MKKILAILLSVLMMASVMALPAFAEATGTTTGAALNDLAAYGQGIYTVAESTPTVNGKIAEDEYTTSMKYHQVSNETWGDIGEYTLYVAQDVNNIYFAAQFDESSRGCTVKGNGGNMNLGSRFRLHINFPSEFTAKDANNYLVLSFNHVGNVTGAKAFGDAEFVAEMGTSALAPYFAATPALMQSGTAGSLNAENSFNAIGLVTAYSFGGQDTNVATYEIALSRVKLMEIFGWNGQTDMTYMASLGIGYQAGTTNFRPWSTQMADSGNYYRPDAAAALEAYSAANGDNTEVAPMVGQAANGQTIASHADVIPDIIKFATHVHDSEGEWVTDDDMHWKECACGETAYEDEHAFDEGAVTREPTKYTEGEKTYTCTVCGYAKVEKTGKLEDKPAATTPSATDAPAATTDGGCFGAVSLAVLAVVPALAVAFVAKKKED